MRIRKKASVMVALRSLDRTSVPLLAKAAELARRFKADIHAAHVISLPYGPVVTTGTDTRAAVQAEVRRRKTQLQTLLAPLGRRGIVPKISVVWDYPVADALVRLVLRHKPDMLLVESHRHGRLARLVLANTDWELIRNCPCPVWLSKSGRLTASSRFLAAVDPLHAHAKPAALDEIIVRQAIAAAPGGREHVLVCHALGQPQPMMVDGVAEPYWMTWSAEELRRHRTAAAEALDKLAARLRIPAGNRIVLLGDAVAQLPRAVKKHGADAIVMGAVSRSGLQRLFVGNTAERVIDAVTCDVVVVKPKRFRTPVLRRPNPPLAFPAA